MAYVSKFKTDTAYGVDDINEITGILTGTGVTPETPNSVLSAVAGSGVTVSNACCAVSFGNSEHTEVKIGDGTVIMADGSYIVLAGGELLPVDTSCKQYVYVFNDAVLQNIPKCTGTLPSDSTKYELLATVENGTITDCRTFSKSKIQAYGTNAICTGSVLPTAQPKTNVYNSRIEMSALPAATTGYNLIIFRSSEAVSTCCTSAIFDLRTNTFISSGLYPGNDNTGAYGVYTFTYENGGFSISSNWSIGTVSITMC